MKCKNNGGLLVLLTTTSTTSTKIVDKIHVKSGINGEKSS